LGLTQEKEYEEPMSDEFDEIEDMVDEDARAKFSTEVIEFFRKPAHAQAPAHFTGSATVTGMCGETLELFVNVENGRIQDIGYVTDGCGPTVACAEAVSALMKGADLTEARELTPRRLLAHVGGLPVDSVHCAGLAVNALRSALKESDRVNTD
jgi:nitrogen fixation NifU-like protein